MLIETIKQFSVEADGRSNTGNLQIYFILYFRYSKGSLKPFWPKVDTL